MTEVAMCFEHGVDESFTPGVDFLACGECWHVWPTQADFQKDVEKLYEEMNNLQWREIDDPEWIVPSRATTANIFSCPLCAHDW